jgi:hypothetical protein
MKSSGLKTPRNSFYYHLGRIQSKTFFLGNKFVGRTEGREGEREGGNEGYGVSSFLINSLSPSPHPHTGGGGGGRARWEG